MRISPPVAVAIALLTNCGANAADPLASSRQKPNLADNDHQCGIMLSVTHGSVETALADVRTRCYADDILRISGATRGPLRTIPAYMATVLCRFDRQIVFIPNGEAMICVYRGAERDSRQRHR